MKRSTHFNLVRCFGVFCAALALMLAIPALSYLNEFTGTTPDHWDLNAFPVTYSINPSVSTNIASGSAAAVAAIQQSFATWNAAPNASFNIAFAGPSNLTANATDGVNLICFVCQGDFTKDSTTLAVTVTTIATAAGENNQHGGVTSGPGQIFDADILFNTAVTWTTGGTPGTNQEDLQTVATHEIGHFLGLDHSAVVRAVMYPFAPSLLSTLSYDDVAAVSALYPKSVPDVPTGSISGTVTFTGGSGVFGGHVFADSTTAGASVFPNIRKSTISTLTKPDGTYTIKGLPPDTYTVGVEPLDSPVTNSNLKSYSTQVGSRPSIDSVFTTRWH
jgi:hypothetical protein